MTNPHTAAQSLARLQAGNLRFVRGESRHPHDNSTWRHHLAIEGQHPLAVVVACADSRESPELIFDCGLGDLFVVRTAGHVVWGAGMGSLEFAALHLAVPLIVVLGHSRCGAIRAALAARSHPLPAGQLGVLVGSLTHVVQAAAKQAGDRVDSEALAEYAMLENVRQTVQCIRQEPQLTPLVEAGKLQVVGGRYDLDSGKVEFLQY